MKGRVIIMAGVVMAMMGLPGTGGNGVSCASGDSNGSEMTIVALGDSLTEGYGVKPKEAYPARMERKLHEASHKWGVVNAGISGETSGEMLLRLDQIAALKPAIVILETGVNDGFQGLEPSIIATNIGDIVEFLKKRGIVVILAGMRMFDSPVRLYNTAFAAIYPEVAKKQHLILIPYFLEGVSGDPSLNRLDGIHPNAKGYRIVVDTVYPYVLKAVEKIDGHR
jgi:acyl-CoA thioesterase I